MLPLWHFILKIPTELDVEQVQEYLFLLQKRSKTPSQTYFKHCVYGLRFLLKSEGLPYEYLHLPSIKHDKKPLQYSVKKKFGDYFNIVNSLNTKYSLVCCTVVVCCMEVRSVRLQDLDFDREQLKVVQGKVKRPLRSLIKTFNSRTQNLHCSRKAKTLFNGQPQGIAGGDFDSRYSQRGVQWAVKQASKAAGITKEVCVHTLRHTLLRIYSKTDSILSHLKISWDMKI
jgi:integrase